MDGDARRRALPDTHCAVPHAPASLHAASLNASLPLTPPCPLHHSSPPPAAPPRPPFSPRHPQGARQCSSPASLHPALALPCTCSTALVGHPQGARQPDAAVKGGRGGQAAAGAPDVCGGAGEQAGGEGQTRCCCCVLGLWGELPHPRSLTLALSVSPPPGLTNNAGGQAGGAGPGVQGGAQRRPQRLPVGVSRSPARHRRSPDELAPRLTGCLRSWHARPGSCCVAVTGWIDFEHCQRVCLCTLCKTEN